MMTVVMFANVTATGGGETVVCQLYGDGMGAVIPHDFGGDLRAAPDAAKNAYT
jgi:hypothetical protein